MKTPNARSREKKDRKKEYQRRWYIKNREKNVKKQLAKNKHLIEVVNRLKSFLSCADCGIKFRGQTCIADFHHLDESKKSSSIRVAACKGKPKLKEELAKCVPLCSNCHRKRHAKSDGRLA